MFRTIIRNVLEALQRPGLMHARGIKRENACRKDLAAYFRELAKHVNVNTLSNLITQDKAHAVHAAEITMQRAVRVARPTLVATLSTHLMLAYLDGWKVAQIRSAAKFKESDNTAPQYVALDQLGDTGQRAADFAAKHAAETVAGIDKTTVSSVQDLVSDAIENQEGPDWLARQIKNLIDGMSRARASLIASTEMNVAFSIATMDKLNGAGVEYKQWITSEDACDVCLDNEADGAIPIDDLFQSGDSEPPAHPGCRCAVAGARPPEWETEEQ